jgi:DNA-binding NtrC family response regulator
MPQKDEDTSSTHSIMMTMNKQLENSFVEDAIESKNKNNNKKREMFFLHKKNNNSKRIIIVDDDEDILFTFRIFLKDNEYHITCFTDPILALNYIQDIPNFDDLLIILDIRMKKLNGIQLHQQIKSIDPTIKIIFITALDILDEILTIVPGISREQIMRKPVDKNLFTYTVKQLLN